MCYWQTRLRVMAGLQPLDALESGLRTELIARQINDIANIQRALAMKSIMPAVLGGATPRQLARAEAGLAAAEALAVEHGLPAGPGLVALGRALTWMPIDMSKASAGLAGAALTFQRHGLGDSPDAEIARDLASACAMFAGELPRALALSGDQLRRPTSGWLTHVQARWVRARVFARQGHIDEARAATEALGHLVRELPMSLPRLQHFDARLALMTAEGRHREVIEVAAAEWASVSRGATLLSSFLRGARREWELEAAIGLALSSELSLRELARFRRAARAQSRERFAYSAVHGLRALACLEHAAGRPVEAERAVRRALGLSSEAGRQRRRQVLRAALAICGEDAAQRAELEALDLRLDAPTPSRLAA